MSFLTGEKTFSLSDSVIYDVSEKYFKSTSKSTVASSFEMVIEASYKPFS